MSPDTVPTRPSEILKFADFAIDLRAKELRRNGARIRLQEQPFQVLALLTQHAGEVVTRDQLRQHLWPADTFVDFDNSLNTAINKIREALDDSTGKPIFIETLPRRGYRFISPVEIHPNGNRTTESSLPSETLGTRHRVWRLVFAAVLLGIALGGIGYWAKLHFARHLTATDTIVLADFDNGTGDPVF